jgi:hypothetical protein
MGSVFEKILVSLSLSFSLSRNARVPDSLALPIDAGRGE